MRFLHTADWHVGKTLRTRKRDEEHKAVLAEMCGIAAEESVDFAIVAGDLFDASAPTPEAEQIVYGGLLSLAEVCPQVIVIAGNHDNANRLRAVAPVFEHIRVITVPSVCKPDDGGVVTIKTKSGETARLALVPFLSQRAALTIDELMGMKSFEQVTTYSGFCKECISALCSGMTSETVNIAAAHLHVYGGHLGGGERPAHTIEQYFVQPDVFPHTLQYVAMGHLHAPQCIAGPCPIWYSGSPLQFDFSDEGSTNVVLIVDVEANNPARVQNRELASGRKLRTLRGTFDQFLENVETQGDSYYRLVVEEQARPGLAEELRELFPNAVEVVLSKSSATAMDDDHARLEQSPLDLFGLYLDEHKVAADDILALFSELLEGGQ